MARGPARHRRVKLLLDEHLAPAIPAALRERGHDVVALVERPEWRQISDEDVLTVALDQRRAIVTNDIGDFRPLASVLLNGGGHHWGMVFVPSTYRPRHRGAGGLVTALAALLEAHPRDDDLQDDEAWL